MLSEAHLESDVGLAVSSTVAPLSEVGWAWTPLVLHTGIEPVSHLPTPLPDPTPLQISKFGKWLEINVVEYRMEKQSCHILSIAIEKRQGDI